MGFKAMTDALPIGILGALSVFLVWHKDYEDGIIGRIALGSIVFVAMIVMMGAWTGKFTYSLPLELSMFLWAVVAFGARHVYRFIRFNRTGENAWKTAANDMQRVVQWETFAPLCRSLLSDGICGNPKAKQGQRCAEPVCPLLLDSTTSRCVARFIPIRGHHETEERQRRQGQEAVLK